MKITAMRTTGLGDTSYLLAHAGAGILVDPQRDIDRFTRAAHDAGVELTHILETHVHNDYVSGAVALAARSGAALVLPAGAGAAYPFVPAFHHEELSGGPYAILPLHTPGHTPEHVSYVVSIDGEPVAVFSGGSLLVGSAGRTDLLGPEPAEQLARLQYRSVRRLAGLPDHLGLYPTHGEGSFCTSTTAGASTSTIAIEKRTNPVLAYADADAFVAGQLAGLQPFPSYYRHMAPLNREGRPAIGEHEVPELDAAALPPEAALVDIRPRADVAAGHIPGSLPLEMSDRVAVWAGWLLPFDQQVALVANRDQDVAEVVRQFGRIGFDHVAGVVYDVERWSGVNGPLASFPLRSAADLAAARRDQPDLQVLDVRSPGDWDDGHLERSIHRYTPDLRESLPPGLDPDRDVWVVCRSGFRAMAASTYLEAAGLRPVVVGSGGVPDVLAAPTADGAG